VIPERAKTSLFRAAVFAAGLAILMPVRGSAAETDVPREQLYLTEVGLVVEGARRLLAYCDQRAGDADFAKFAQPLAERYVELASRMLPSPKATVVHPHLLLVVENLERALDAAASADAATYQKRIRVTRDELSNLEAVLKQLKLRLPEPPR
jgi:hypothetical protein